MIIQTIQNLNKYKYKLCTHCTGDKQLLHFYIVKAPKIQCTALAVCCVRLITNATPKARDGHEPNHKSNLQMN